MAKRAAGLGGIGAAAMLAVSVSGASLAHADFKIHMPIVVQGELEIEGYADRSFDHRADKSNAQSQKIGRAHV